MNAQLRARRLAHAILSTAMGSSLVAACGARTALFVDDVAPSAAEEAGPGSVVDATAPFDAAAPQDSSPSSTSDASMPIDALSTVDARVPFDAAPAIDASTSCPRNGYLWASSGELYSFEPQSVSATRLGLVTCPTAASPWSMSVSRTGVGYLMYSDWNIYRVDLTTLACTTTPYVPYQLGLGSQTALAVSDDLIERLFVYGLTNAGPLLAVTNLTSFALSAVQEPEAPAIPPDMQADAYGHLFVLSDSSAAWSSSTRRRARSSTRRTRRSVGSRADGRS